MTILDFRTRRTTDLNPAGGADNCLARVGRNWRAAVERPQPCATYNDTRPWEPDEAPPLTPFAQAEQDSKLALRLTTSIIVLAVVVAVVFAALTIWPGKS